MALDHTTEGGQRGRQRHRAAQSATLHARSSSPSRSVAEPYRLDAIGDRRSSSRINPSGERHVAGTSRSLAGRRTSERSSQFQVRPDRAEQPRTAPRSRRPGASRSARADPPRIEPDERPADTGDVVDPEGQARAGSSGTRRSGSPREFAIRKAGADRPGRCERRSSTARPDCDRVSGSEGPRTSEAAV